MKHWPFTVINDNTRPKVQVEYKGETKAFYPEEISSMVLTKMKEIAEAYLGKVGFCQIPCPHTPHTENKESIILCKHLCLQ